MRGMGFVAFSKYKERKEMQAVLILIRHSEDFKARGHNPEFLHVAKGTVIIKLLSPR